MARTRQQNPQNYSSSGNISAEFENVYRYLNAAELGNKTIGELLSVLFDDDGKFDGPIEFRTDPVAGLQYRIGEGQDWQNLASLESLRGPSGVDVGDIGLPIILGRLDMVATALQTEFDYAFTAVDDLLVYDNGVLMVEGVDYTKDVMGGANLSGSVTFLSGVPADHVISIFRLRAPLIAGYRRTDFETITTQQVFAFEHNDEDKLQVYLNGVLLREGGAYDYSTQPASDTITLNTPIVAGNILSVIFAENAAVRTVSGLMLGERYLDLTTGLIRLDRVAIPNDGIPQEKIAGLTPILDTVTKITLDAVSPVNPQATDLWLDTSQTPNQLKFYDGTRWLLTSPESGLPTYTSDDAKRYIRVNATGTRLEYTDLDLSSAIGVTQKGAANGVATLDSNGRLPFGQLPEVLGSDSYWLNTTTPTDATTYTVKRIFKQKVRIDGIAVATTSGTCTVQITLDGVGVGSTYTANSAGLATTIGSPIEVDATAAARNVGFKVTGNASASGLDVTLAAAIIAA